MGSNIVSGCSMWATVSFKLAMVSGNGVLTISLFFSQFRMYCFDLVQIIWYGIYRVRWDRR